MLAACCHEDAQTFRRERAPAFTYNFHPTWDWKPTTAATRKTGTMSDGIDWTSLRVAQRRRQSFSLHTLLGYNRLTVPECGLQQRHRRDSGRRNGHSIFGAGISLRLFEADYAVGATTILPMRFRPAFPDLRRPSRGRPAAHRFGLQLRLRIAAGSRPRACSIEPSEVMVGRAGHGHGQRQQFQSQAHSDLQPGAGTGGKVTGKDNTGDHRHQRSRRRQLHGYGSRHRSQDEEGWRGELHRELHGERTAEESADHVVARPIRHRCRRARRRP